jgi:hypothetical protein
MEKNLSATFKKVDDMELAAHELRKQGVLDIQFDDSVPIQIDYQSNTLIDPAAEAVLDNSYALQVSVELSRYRQAEDTITKYGGQI